MPLNQGAGRVVLGGRRFTPTQVSGLALWLDFSDTSKLFQDTLATTPAVADTDPVRLCQDKSGLGRDAVAGSDAGRPLLKLAIQNSQSVARFDGSDDFLTVATALPRPITVVGVVRDRDHTVNGSYFDGSAGNQARLLTDTGKLDLYSTGYVVTAASVNAATGPLLFSVGFGAAGTFARYNRVDQAIAAQATGDPTALVLGALGNEAADFKNCDWCELLVYDSILPLVSVVAIESYLNARWGVL